MLRPSKDCLCFFCSLLLLAACPLLAQQAKTGINDPSPALLDKFSRYQHYSMEQGLSNNSVSCIAQDNDGFLWFGTEEGLNRFDGEHFTSFFQRADNKGVVNNHITQMISLPGNRLLIGTEKGLCLLYTRQLVFDLVSLPARPQADYLKQDPIIQRILRAKNGQIWIGTDAGIHLLDPQLNVLQSYVEPVEPIASMRYHVYDFVELPDGTILVKFPQSGEPNLSPWQVIDFQQNKRVSLSELRPECSALDDAVSPGGIISMGSDRLLYCAMSVLGVSKIHAFDWETKKRSTLFFRGTAFPSNMQKRFEYSHPFLLPDSLLFLQRYFGAPIVYNLRDGSSTELRKWKTSWPDGKGIVNFLDRNGNLWLCPRFEGIYFLTLKNLPATPMTALNAVHKKRMKEVGVPDEWYGFIGLEHAGNWVVSSGNGGLYSMDKNGRGVSGRVLDNPFKSYAYVRYFAPDRGDTLWTISLDGLNWYSAASNTSGSLRTHIRGLDSLNHRFIYRDHHGLIWSRVFNNGVCYFDTRSRALQHFPSKGEQAPFPILSATACSEGPDGDMWFSFGSEKQYIVRWRRSTRVFEKIEPICPPGVRCAEAFRIMADPHGNVWLYADQRWFVMDANSHKVQAFGKENGLITNNPAGICLDKTGNTWFATSFGLSRYDPRNHQLRTFYQTDGLLSNSIANVELIDTARNILFVSTDQGMCLFEPDKVGIAAAAPPTYITGIRVSDQEIPLSSSGTLTFPYHQNDLRISFTAVNFINGTMNRYQYSMERAGRAVAWKDAGSDNFANFLNLEPGRYTFYVRTANSDGVWGEAAATLGIVIYPPWWRTWSFQLSLLAILAALGGWFYQRQIKQAEFREAEKAKVLQQMGDLEMRALRSQMNPHFVFNALNSVQNFILKNDTREASRYLTKFARLMRLILENSESPVVLLAREIELLRYYTELEALRFNHRFTFGFEIDSQLNPESAAIPAMLIQPHIENAIWHGLMHKEGMGTLRVSFKKVNNRSIVCEIEDNGVGRAKAAEIEQDRPKNHRSTGLANIQHRLNLLNAQLADDIRLEFIDLYDDHGNAAGTKVVVYMPNMSNQRFSSSKN